MANKIDESHDDPIPFFGTDDDADSNPFASYQPPVELQQAQRAVQPLVSQQSAWSEINDAQQLIDSWTFQNDQPDDALDQLVLGGNDNNQQQQPLYQAPLTTTTADYQRDQQSNQNQNLLKQQQEPYQQQQESIYQQPDAFQQQPQWTPDASIENQTQPQNYFQEPFQHPDNVGPETVEAPIVNLLSQDGNGYQQQPQDFIQQTVDQQLWYGQQGQVEFDLQQQVPPDSYNDRMSQPPAEGVTSDGQPWTQSHTLVGSDQVQVQQNTQQRLDYGAQQPINGQYEANIGSNGYEQQQKQQQQQQGYALSTQQTATQSWSQYQYNQQAEVPYAYSNRTESLKSGYGSSMQAQASEPIPYQSAPAYDSQVEQPTTQDTVYTAQPQVQAWTLPPSRASMNPLEEDRYSSISYRTNPTDFKTCPSCRKLNDMDANFCQKCGGKLANVGTTTISAIPQRILSPGSIGSDRSSRYSAPTYAVVDQRLDNGQQYVLQSQDVRSEPSASRAPSTAMNRPDMPPMFPQQQQQQQKPSFVDPLGRTGHPLVAFGFGGQLIVMFPKTSNRFTSVNGQMSQVSKLYSSFLQVHSMRKILSTTAQSSISQAQKFNGPLSRLKKKDVMKILDDLILEAIGERAVLLKLLKALCELDVKTGNSDAIAKALLTKTLNLQTLAKQDFASVSVNQVLPRSDSLSAARSFLFEGNRLEAAKLLLDAGNVAHALVIAAHCNKDIYNSIVKQICNDSFNPEDPMHTLYSLFASQSEESVINFDAAAHWQSHLVMMLNNRTALDVQAINLLGELLEKANKDYAAHICYLSVSGQQAFDATNARSANIVLLGQNSTSLNKCILMDSIRLTELFEYIVSQNSGSQPFSMPHLLVYKLKYASFLADIGMIDESAKYCDSIVQVVKVQSKPLPFLDRNFAKRLEQLSECLAGSGVVVSGEAGSGAWLSKMPKGIFDAFDRGLTKIISGNEVDAVKPPQKSSLAKALPSSRSSQPDKINSPYNNAVPTVNGSSTFGAYTAPSSAQQSYSVQAQDPYSAYGYGNSYMQTKSHAQASQMQKSQTSNQFDPYGQSSYGSYAQNTTVTAQASQSPNGKAEPQVAAYGQQQTFGYNQNLPGQTWQNGMDASYASAQSLDLQGSVPTQPIPVQNNSNQIDQRFSEYGSPKKLSPEAFPQSFGAPMKAFELDSQERQFNQPAAQPFQAAVKDEEDFGFGNRSLSQQRERRTSVNEQPAARPRAQSVATSTPSTGNDTPQETPAEGGTIVSTLTRAFSFLRREKSTASASSTTSAPKPKEVNLGEKSKFYFDPVLKKWVNENSQGSNEGPSSVAPPPKEPVSRPPTAPPSMQSQQQAFQQVQQPHVQQQNGSFDSAMPPSGPRKVGTLRRGARSRYVDTLNAGSSDTRSQGSSSRPQSSFMPEPTALQSFEGVSATPRIMTPGQQQQLQPEDKQHQYNQYQNQ